VWKNFEVAKLSPPEGSLHVAPPEQRLVWATLKITAMPQQSVCASPVTMEEKSPISLFFSHLLSFCPSTIRLTLCIACRSLALDRAGLSVYILSHSFFSSLIQIRPAQCFSSGNPWDSRGLVRCLTENLYILPLF